MRGRRGLAWRLMGSSSESGEAEVGIWGDSGNNRVIDRHEHGEGGGIQIDDREMTLAQRKNASFHCNRKE